MKLLPVAFALIALVLPGLLAATTIYVDDDAPGDPGPGDPAVSDPFDNGSAAHPFDAIQEGINAAIAGDTVLVADGTYTGDDNRDLDFNGKAITVRSENGAASTMIDCQGSLAQHRGFVFRSGETAASVLEGFTIRDGHMDEGGAILCRSASSPTIRNCVLADNFSKYRGGGIYCWDGSNVTITGCTIEDNVSLDDGAGVYCSGSELTVTDCVIRRNAAAWSGGGIYLTHSSPTITDCTITGNTATWAGGIDCDNFCSPAISACVISDNSATNSGGGIRVISQSHPTITNCLVARNSAPYGGAIHFWYSVHATVANCTFVGNTTGIICGHESCAPTITNSILWDNGTQEVDVSDGATPAVSYSDVQNGTGEFWFDALTCLDEDPLFVTGPLHDCYLSETAAGQGTDSPCIDAGSNTAVTLGLDDRTTRTDEAPDVGIVDMGYHAETSSRVRGDVDGNGIVNGLDLTAVISAWETEPGDPLWDPAADLDGNGVINGLDLTEVISNWTE